VTFRASPDTLFDLYLSSRNHSVATGAKAVMSRRVRYNRAAAMQGTQGELASDLSVPRSLTESQRR